MQSCSFHLPVNREDIKPWYCSVYSPRLQTTSSASQTNWGSFLLIHIDPRQFSFLALKPESLYFQRRSQDPVLLRGHVENVFQAPSRLAEGGQPGLSDAGNLRRESGHREAVRHEDPGFASRLPRKRNRHSANYPKCSGQWQRKSVSSRKILEVKSCLQKI